MFPVLAFFLATLRDSLRTRAALQAESSPCAINFLFSSAGTRNGDTSCRPLIVFSGFGSRVFGHTGNRCFAS
jgi:hypothetical protein